MEQMAAFPEIARDSEHDELCPQNDWGSWEPKDQGLFNAAVRELIDSSRRYHATGTTFVAVGFDEFVKVSSELECKCEDLARARGEAAVLDAAAL